jgi:hypothetical protein
MPLPSAGRRYQRSSIAASVMYRSPPIWLREAGGLVGQASRPSLVSGCAGDSRSSAGNMRMCQTVRFPMGKKERTELLVLCLRRRTASFPIYLLVAVPVVALPPAGWASYTQLFSCQLELWNRFDRNRRSVPHRPAVLVSAVVFISIPGLATGTNWPLRRPRPQGPPAIFLQFYEVLAFLLFYHTT